MNEFELAAVEAEEKRVDGVKSKLPALALGELLDTLFSRPSEHFHGEPESAALIAELVARLGGEKVK